MTSQVNEADNGTGTPGAYGKAGERLSAAYSTSIDKAAGAIDTARQRAADAARRTADGIEQNPVAALMGGLALGAIVGAMLPGTRKEAELLGPLGGKVGDAAKTAAQAARETGLDKLDEFGLSRDNVREKVSKIFDDALKVAGETSSAAAERTSSGSQLLSTWLQFRPHSEPVSQISGVELSLSLAVTMR